MKFRFNAIYAATISATSIAAAATLLAGQALAQTTTAVSPPQKIEKIEVTGSNIKRVDAETASPIQIITADDIRRSGQTTVTQLLRELPSNAAGGLTELAGSGSFSAGAASASLRGLGSSATLVLLNGRRIAPYGLADPNFGQSGAVNLNAIPIDAIERIEILKDGASAIYGSEAIAGVINIILRKDFKGLQLGVTTAANKSNEFGNTSINASFGIGDLAKDKYNFFANIEVYRQKHVLTNNVIDYLANPDIRSAYGTLLVNSSFSPFLTYLTNATGGSVSSPGPGCPAANVVPRIYNGFNITGSAAGTACVYDNTSRVEVIPKTERNSIFARSTYELRANTELFAEGSYVENKTYFLGFPQPVGSGTGATFNPSTGFLNPSPTILPVGHPNNPFNVPTRFRGRLDSVGNQDNEVLSKTTRVVAGFKSVLGSFDVSGGVLYSLTEQDTINYNAIRYSALVAGITGGGFNFYSPNTGAVTANDLRVNAKDNAKSSFTIVDLKSSGEIGNLPGGAASVAIGAEFRREERKVTPDPIKLVGGIFGRGVASADGSRDVSTLFGELVLPVVTNVEVQAALRYDRYSDYGSSLTPKVAATWAIAPTFKLRTSFARGFRAPALTEITKSTTSGFFNGVDDPRRCLRPTYTAGCAVLIPALIVANPLVRPEKAESYTGGFIWEPSTSSSISVDYFSITRRNEISFLSLTEILNNEGSTDPRYAGRITRDPTNTSPTVPNDPGAILFVSTGFNNLGETRVKGLDVDARYSMSLAEYGKLTFNFNATQYFEQRSSGAPNAPVISYTGFRNAPEFRGIVRTTWESGNWVSTGTMNYLSSFKTYSNPENNGPGAVAPDCGNKLGTFVGFCTVSEYITYDLGTEYRGIKNLSLSGTVRNLANRKPSADPLARPFNTTWYQPTGMNFVLSARYTFF